MKTITSESIKEIASALAKAQAVMSGAKKGAENPHFRSKYADLASCWDAARAALPEQGLCVIQTTRPSDKDEVVVITLLAHSSGEWIEGELPLPVTKADAQGYGSALTYARRYGLCAMVGIAPEDDDGNAAANAKPNKQAGKMPTKEFVDHCTAMGSAVNTTDLQKAYSTAYRAAEGYQDEQALKSLTAKKDELKEILMRPTLAEQG